jgi:hypothetical protein
MFLPLLAAPFIGPILMHHRIHPPTRIPAAEVQDGTHRYANQAIPSLETPLATQIPGPTSSHRCLAVRKPYANFIPTKRQLPIPQFSSFIHNTFRPRYATTKMNSSATIDADSLCPYVPLTRYDWKISVIYNEDCRDSVIPFNTTVFCIIAALHAVTVWMALCLIVRVLITFKSWRTFYFR